jgi:hypothetical protein
MLQSSKWLCDFLDLWLCLMAAVVEIVSEVECEKVVSLEVMTRCRGHNALHHAFLHHHTTTFNTTVAPFLEIALAGSIECDLGNESRRESPSSRCATSAVSGRAGRAAGEEHEVT